MQSSSNNTLEVRFEDRVSQIMDKLKALPWEDIVQKNTYYGKRRDVINSKTLSASLDSNIQIFDEAKRTMNGNEPEFIVCYPGCKVESLCSTTSSYKDNEMVYVLHKTPGVVTVYIFTIGTGHVNSANIAGVTPGPKIKLSKRSRNLEVCDKPWGRKSMYEVALPLGDTKSYYYTNGRNIYVCTEGGQSKEVGSIHSIVAQALERSQRDKAEKAEKARETKKRKISAVDEKVQHTQPIPDDDATMDFLAQD